MGLFASDTHNPKDRTSVLKNNSSGMHGHIVVQQLLLSVSRNFD